MDWQRVISGEKSHPHLVNALEFGFYSRDHNVDHLGGKE